MRYIEFACTSNFSFLRGASHPEELMAQAARLRLDGLALADRNSVAGVVRAHVAKRESGLPLAYHPGARLVFSDGTPDILAYPRDRPAWGRLTRLLTLGNRRAEKGDCVLMLDDLLGHVEGLELIVMEASSFTSPCSFPSPRLRGEGGEPRSGEPGEGLFLKAQNRSNAPSPAPPTLTLRRVDLSPQAGRGERERGGRERAEQAARKQAKSAERKELLSRLRSAAPRRVRLAASMLYRGDDRARLARRVTEARENGVPLIAVNDVLYHAPERRPVQDVLACIREHMTLQEAGRRLMVNAERHLKTAAEMARLFRDCPDAVNETLHLSERLTFSLDELRYEYPDETRAGFATPQEALTHFTYEGAALRYPNGVPAKVRANLEHELALIASLNYAPYFLTVHDIVRFARSRNILCQGRGSAANSAVCFCLGVTEVDPERCDLLFERFVSAERREPPDIDIDFEHERREEVIQYIYQRYSRERAGLAATVISYRGRSAVREVGKAFGLSEDTIGAVASSIWGGGGGQVRYDDLRRVGLKPESPAVAKMLDIIGEVISMPRHLSQHVGGFVITQGRLDEVVPIQNAAMEDRTCVEWDKDDLDALGILKIDVLGLGMLTCLRKALDLVGQHYPEALPSPTRGEGAATILTLAAIPAEDPAVYRMLQRADSLGVFQIESRAQMSMLPRLKPATFYDLVIEVAIVRPGPIQGDMVHPYLRRRQGLEPVSFPSKELESVLGKTLGVPLFQEQAMKIAIVAAGFTPSEADKLRRAMATFRKVGTIGTFERKMIEGMAKNGYDREFAERCFSQIEGFGEYGFPESHAASFALLVYASAWLKCHYPDVFAAALLNAQPMGFYAPAQIVRDAREHGVEVRPPDINHSYYEATLEPGPEAAGQMYELHREMAGDIRTRCAIRLGLREIKGLRKEDAEAIVARRLHPMNDGERSSFFTSPLAGEIDQRRLAGVDREEDKQQTPALIYTPLPIPPPQGAREHSVHEARETSYDSLRDLWLRTDLSPRVIERLADADAFGSLGLSRRDALWAVKALQRSGDHEDLPLFRAATARRQEPDVALKPMPPGEEVVNDYRFLKLSLRAHPASFLRADLARRRIVKNETLRTTRNGTRVHISGLITVRQRPGTAKGVIFMTIEDETGVANVIVWPKAFERFRAVVLGARYVGIFGPMQEEAGVIHVIAERIDDLTPLLAQLADGGGDIEGLARCDDVKRPGNTLDPRARETQRPQLRAMLAELPDVADSLDVQARATRHTVGKRKRTA